MTHAILVLTATTQQDNPSTVPDPPPPTIPSVLPDRIDQNVLPDFSTVLDGSSGPDKQEDVAQATADDGTDYIEGLYRFAADEDRAAILDTFETKAVADIEWWGLYHHDCTHDIETGEGQGDCPDWGAPERSYGTIPEVVQP